MNQIKHITALTLKKWIESDEAFLIDVRTPGEYNIEKIANSQNIPLDEILANNIKLQSNKKIVVICRAGVRSLTACKKLTSDNPLLEIWNLEGGILAWKSAGFEI